MSYWLFQADDGYDLTQEIPGRLHDGDFWLVRRYRDQLKAGAKVAFWQSGKGAGIYGLGTLTTAPYEMPNADSKSGFEWRIGVAYSKLLDYPLYAGELRGTRDLASLPIIKQPYAANPFPIKAAEWISIQRLMAKKTVNIFSHYKQEEDQFTNGLMGILDLSRHQDGKQNLLRRFFKQLASLDVSGDNCRLRVLGDIEGTADAEICTRSHCVRIETKVRSGTLRDEQLRSHLRRLDDSPAEHKVLVLITPDDRNSDYIAKALGKPYVRAFRDANPQHMVIHVGWMAIYRHLEDFAKETGATPLSKLIVQFLEQIHDCIFEQDYAGIIQKISFGDVSEVYEDKYLDELKADEWRRWNTPRKYEKLDGTGRKLLLYDKSRSAITVEAEIQKVCRTNEERAFPWSNFFVPRTVKVYDPPIPLERILAIPGFENFKSGRAANWNVTQEQYKLLTT